jgi:hypothetical protein
MERVLRLKADLANFRLRQLGDATSLCERRGLAAKVGASSGICPTSSGQVGVESRGPAPEGAGGDCRCDARLAFPNAAVVQQSVAGHVPASRARP